MFAQPRMSRFNRRKTLKWGSIVGWWEAPSSKSQTFLSVVCAMFRNAVSVKNAGCEEPDVGQANFG